MGFLDTAGCEICYRLPATSSFLAYFGVFGPEIPSVSLYKALGRVFCQTAQVRRGDCYSSGVVEISASRAIRLAEAAS